MYSGLNTPPSALKGIDGIIFRALDAAGLKPEFVAIIVDDEERELDEDGSDADGISELYSEHTYYRITGQKEGSIQNDDYGSHIEYLMANHGVEEIWAKWIVDPANCAKEYYDTGTFMYGNYPASADEFYLQHAIVCHIPMYEERIRLCKTAFMMAWNPVLGADAEISAFVPKDVAKKIVNEYL